MFAKYFYERRHLNLKNIFQITYLSRQGNIFKTLEGCEKMLYHTAILCSPLLFVKYMFWCKKKVIRISNFKGNGCVYVD